MAAKLPKQESQGEALFALHLWANKIAFERQYRPPNCPRKWAWDFRITGTSLLIEVNGSIWKKGAHNTGSGLERDYSKSNWATLNGWICLSYSTGQVERGDAINDVLSVRAQKGGKQ